jgi:predicted DNA-binding transcriptional regulator YafY
MNRTDRLFAITVMLQGRARVRAADLAATFGVSERTIYRDMAALNEGGVPIVSLPGAGYELMPGYTLPPLAFTPAEATALALGARLLAQQAAGRWPASAETAVAKIVAILPAAVREQVDRLTGIVHFVTPAARFDLDDPRLALLRQAIAERRVVWLRYHGRARDEPTERAVEPARLTYGDGVWFLSGYCRLREGPRAFRLDRIEELAPLAERFTPRAVAAPPAGEPPIVQIRVAARAARWVRERQHYAFIEEMPDPDGDGVIMTYRPDAAAELTPWLLGWGAAVEVLAPPELREAIRREAQALADLLRDEE